LKGIAAIERFLPDNNDKSYLIIRDQRYLRSILQAIMLQHCQFFATKAQRRRDSQRKRSVELGVFLSELEPSWLHFFGCYTSSFIISPFFL